MADSDHLHHRSHDRGRGPRPAAPRPALDGPRVPQCLGQGTARKIGRPIAADAKKPLPQGASRAARGGSGSQRGIRSTARQGATVLSIGSARYPYLQGQEWGSGHYPQFPSWRPAPYKGSLGYFFWPAIEEGAEEVARSAPRTSPPLTGPTPASAGPRTRVMASRTLTVVLAGRRPRSALRRPLDGEKRMKFANGRARRPSCRRRRRADRGRTEAGRPASAGDGELVAQGGQGLRTRQFAARGPGLGDEPCSNRTGRPLRRAEKGMTPRGCRHGRRRRCGTGPADRRAGPARPHLRTVQDLDKPSQVRQAARRDRLGRRLRPSPSC